ncbi:MAG: protease modulator HflC [Bacteriovoracaceae bacterium]|jgi:modulator of FtsH protease HflC|nr:protease modulator HflC [Bacteriovoracaceae bacterium]
MKRIIAAIVAFLFVVVSYSSAYILTEGRQAIITQFGKPIGDPITEAGLHFKTPFLQDVRYVDKRILTWDGFPNQIPTKDKKYISVDTTARWRIIDALKFIQTVQNERGAKARLDAILDAITRDTISNHNLVEAVRNSDDILKRLEIVNKVSEDKATELDKILVGREKLSQIIAERAARELIPFGITIIDVQLRRISYEKSVESKVFERMISERKKIAEKTRSVGKGEKAKIEGRLEKDLQKIKSEAYKAAQIIRGEGEAKAILIYAKSLSKDPKFFEFIKSMEVYKSSLKAETEFILSTDSDFLKYLKKNR